MDKKFELTRYFVLEIMVIQNTSTYCHHILNCSPKRVDLVLYLNINLKALHAKMFYVTDCLRGSKAKRRK